jgi:hypothetical protein
MKKLITLILVVGGLVWGQQTAVNTAVVTSPPPSGVAQTFVTNVGVTGQTSYCYYVVTVYNIGMTSNGPVTCTTSANATLSGGNYNTISWTVPSGGVPIGYWVIRSNGSGVFPGTGTFSVNATVLSASTLTLNDQSNTLNAWTYLPAGFAYYSIGVNNKDFGVPVLVVSNSAGVTQAQWYMTNNQTHQSEVYSTEGNVTSAVLNTGPIIVAPILGAQVKIVGFLLQAIGGAAATCTSVQVVDTTGTPVVGVQANAAQLTQNTVNTEGSASMVLTTFLTNFASGIGLAVRSVGGACTTMTSLNYRVYYKVTP